MPTYELTCKACGNRFERFLLRLIKDADRVCPACGSTEVVAGVGGGVVKASSGGREACAPRGGFG